MRRAVLSPMLFLIAATPAVAQMQAQPQQPSLPVLSPPPPPAPSMSAPVPGASRAQTVMGPTLEADTNPATYGPSLPKSAHGRIAQVDWPRAPVIIPRGLEEAINIVTRTYPSTGSARAALRAAASDLRAARNQWFPTISASAIQYSSEHDPIPSLIIDQPIWSGDRIGSGIRRARASEDASSAQYVDTVHSLALTTAQTYYQIVSLTQHEQLLTESLREHQRLVETIDRRVRQEVSPLADLNLARSRTAQVEQDLNVAHAQRLTQLRVLAQLVADANYEIGPVPFYDPAIDLPARDALEDQAVVYSPQLRRLTSEIDISRAELDARKAALLPQVGAEYSYDQFYHHRIGVIVRAQNDATQLPQVNAARARITQAEDDRRSSEAELRREVASDLIEFEAAKSRARIAQEVAVSAVAVSESFMRQYIAGRRSWLDVMNQLREAVDARIEESDAQVSVMATATRLTIESGRWRPKFDVTAP